ncbi:MAG: hypothetical protein FWH50_00330, partial [Coriobacteriia bacterium]|nr:hypothetical protein [Coriobacteriia bacterium]
QLDQDETQRIGSYYFGYITVPVSWIPYKDHNPNDGIYQYWDASRNLIISLILMESTDIEGLADIYISRHEDRVPIEVEYATDQMELDGNPVYHFTCHHLDDSGCCAVYLLHGPSGGTNYIIAEGPTDFILEAINMVEQTFSFEDKQIASLV